MPIASFDGEFIKLIWDKVLMSRRCIKPKENIFPECFKSCCDQISSGIARSAG